MLPAFATEVLTGAGSHGTRLSLLMAAQGLGGRALSVPIVASAATGTWRVRAYTDPKRPAIGETTFMVEDYVPDRVEFDLATKATGIHIARVTNSTGSAIAVCHAAAAPSRPARSPTTPAEKPPRSPS